MENDEKEQLKKYLKNSAKRAFNSKNKEKLYDTNKLLFSFFNCEYSELLTLPPDFSENIKFECFLKISSNCTTNFRYLSCCKVESRICSSCSAQFIEPDFTCTLCSEKEIQESTIGKKIWVCPNRFRSEKRYFTSFNLYKNLK